MAEEVRSGIVVGAFTFVRMFIFWQFGFNEYFLLT